MLSLGVSRQSRRARPRIIVRTAASKSRVANPKSKGQKRRTDEEDEIMVEQQEEEEEEMKRVDANVYFRGGIAIYRAEDPENGAGGGRGQTPDDNRPVNHRPNKGIAEEGELESYPCSLCPGHQLPQRVFLTPAGLERHAAQQHPELTGKVQSADKNQQVEWAKRAKKRKGGHSREEHEVHRHILLPKKLWVCDNYSQCNRCGLQLDPRDFPQHLYQHQHNDELRLWIEQSWGNQAVQRLLCHFCDLVFSSDHGLDQHIRLAHSTHRQFSQRHRNFGCPFCVKQFATFGALEAHKREAHLIGNGDEEMTATYALQIGLSPAPSSNCSSSSALVRLQCPVCGLALSRPSLLVQHCHRVHNRMAADLSVLIRHPKVLGQPPIHYRLDKDGQLLWQCCARDFSSKEALLSHRASAHPTSPPSPSSANNNNSIDNHGLALSSQPPMPTTTLAANDPHFSQSSPSSATADYQENVHGEEEEGEEEWFFLPSSSSPLAAVFGAAAGSSSSTMFLGNTIPVEQECVVVSEHDDDHGNGNSSIPPLPLPSAGCNKNIRQTNKLPITLPSFNI